MRRNIILTALLAMTTILSAIGASTDPVSMRITLKNNTVVSYNSTELDSVRFIGGLFGETGAVGMKVYLTSTHKSVDYLYSQIADVEYGVQAPTFSRTSGSIFTDVTPVTISSTSGATIYYTTDGSTPSATNYAGTGVGDVVVTIDDTYSSPVTLKAVAMIGNEVSSVASATYTLQFPVDAPTFSRTSGSIFTDATTVVTIFGASGATIYYTIDGSTPGANNHAGYGTTEVNVAVTQSMTIKAVAVKNGVSSEVASATYTVDVPVVESNDFSLATSNDDLVAGTKLVVAYNQSGYLMSTTKSGTSNGFIETTSGFEFSADKSTVTLEDGCNAMVLTLGGEEGAWTLTDESGKYFTMAANAVTTTLEDESTVYYTIDISSDGGATIKPSGSGVTRMLRMNQLTSNGRFASYAQATGGLVQIYVQEGAGGVTTVKDPVFSRTSGSTFNTASTNVTITTGTSGATVYYTVNGTTPSATNYAGSGLKTVTLTVTQSVTVKAIAIKDGVSSNVVTATYTVDTSGDSNMNRNSRSSYYNASKKMWNLEWPRIKDDDNQSWVIKEAGGYTTYALEWDNSKIANRYTCYQMFDNNWDGSASRKDNFIEDPDLPSATRSKQSDYSSSGFSRGHLCPSADRTLTQTQNDQTFYFSNMQPQYQNHNGGQWSTYEGKVRTWAAQFDTLYVVKAATIDNITLNNSTQSGVFNFTCNDRLPVAKYFYMALMGYKKSTNTYTAVGIWTYHYNNTSERKTAEHITIDELERRTGIDFFCNLPDDVEEEMESKAVDSSIWGSPQ